MQIVFSMNRASLSEPMRVVHKGVELMWSAVPYEHTELYKDVVDTFDYINRYWAQLPEQAQDEIFATYSKIRMMIDGTQTSDQMANGLRELVAELLDKHHDLTAVRHWLDYYSDISVPERITEKFMEGDTYSFHPSTTYLKEEYLQLVAMAIVMRAMIPIWGEFMFRTRAECGTNFKGFYAYKLMARAAIMQSEELEKLHEYVRRLVSADVTNMVNVLEGVSTYDQSTHELSRVVVRRLAVGDIRGIDQKSNIVAFIYKYLKQRVNGRRTGAGYADNVKAKIPETSAVDGDKISILEGYKIQDRISLGDIAIIKQYLENPIKVAQKVEPDIDMMLLQKSLTSVEGLAQEIIGAGQIALIQWVLAPAIPPRGMETLNKRSLMNAVAVAQAVLWHRGHKALAALISAHQARRTDDTIRVMAVENRGKIPAEILGKLAELYPFYLRIGARTSTKTINPATAAIDNLTNQFAECEWILTIPRDWYSELPEPQTGRIYNVPFAIRTYLGNLVIDIASRKKGK